MGGYKDRRWNRLSIGEIVCCCSLLKHMLGPLQDQTTSSPLLPSCIKEFVTSTAHYKEGRMNALPTVKEMFTFSKTYKAHLAERSTHDGMCFWRSVWVTLPPASLWVQLVTSEWILSCPNTQIQCFWAPSQYSICHPLYIRFLWINIVYARFFRGLTICSIF